MRSEEDAMKEYLIGDNTYTRKITENGEEILESKREGFTVRCRFTKDRDESNTAINALKEYLANVR